MDQTPASDRPDSGKSQPDPDRPRPSIGYPCTSQGTSPWRCLHRVPEVQPIYGSSRLHPQFSASTPSRNQPERAGDSTPSKNEAELAANPRTFEGIYPRPRQEPLWPYRNPWRRFPATDLDQERIQAQHRAVEASQGARAFIGTAITPHDQQPWTPNQISEYDRYIRPLVAQIDARVDASDAQLKEFNVRLKALTAQLEEVHTRLKALKAQLDRTAEAIAAASARLPEVSRDPPTMAPDLLDRRLKRLRAHPNADEADPERAENTTKRPRYLGPGEAVGPWGSWGGHGSLVGFRQAEDARLKKLKEEAAEKDEVSTGAKSEVGKTSTHDWAKTVMTPTPSPSVWGYEADKKRSDSPVWGDIRTVQVPGDDKSKEAAVDDSANSAATSSTLDFDYDDDEEEDEEDFEDDYYDDLDDDVHDDDDRNVEEDGAENMASGYVGECW